MKQDIDRIAGRMAHRANDITGAALSPGYLEGIRLQIAGLKKRSPTQESAVGEKIADLEDREKRLLKAAADYKKAEKIIRAFPAILEAARGMAAIFETLGDRRSPKEKEDWTRAITVGQEATK